ncbi:MAG TPA: hypothetical protein VFP33_08085 [Gallionella sp.]|nr:hypothetical protein [Gallionella sp.]
MKKALIALLLLALAGCSTSSTKYSNSFIKPSKPINEMKVLYLEHSFFDPATRRPADLSLIAYADIPELLRERAVKVFRLNKIASEYATLKKQDFGQEQQIQAIKWSSSDNASSALLVIEVTNVYWIRGQRTPLTYFITTNANLFGTNGSSRIWTGQFENRFMQPPVGHVGFDNESADRLLKMILEQMEKDGIIELAGGKALLPKQEKSAN